MIAWGGDYDSNFGYRYHPASDTWRSTSRGAYTPAGRNSHTAVWTGDKMIVWGGLNTSLQTFSFESGSLYCAQPCTPTAWYADADGDGYGVAAAVTQACSAPTGFVAVSGDCDDNDSSVNPSAPDLPGDPKDQNCDGTKSCDPTAP